ncbi:MAG TPA: type II toxin-antitoxin system VapC family toxin [Tepidisphaeraceae bacterium]|jgi:predicted nucleic acid-binding protein
MARYFLDTNLLLRFIDSNDALHSLAAGATLELLKRGHELTINSQVLIELWGVATRPATNNGLGWDPVKIEQAIQFLRGRFTFLEDSNQVFSNWLQLVTTHGVRGKQVHDTRIAAAMLAHGVTEILTFNGADFKRFTTIRAISPADIVGSP